MEKRQFSLDFEFFFPVMEKDCSEEKRPLFAGEQLHSHLKTFRL